jgi:hypothetical protein
LGEVLGIRGRAGDGLDQFDEIHPKLPHTEPEREAGGARAQTCVSLIDFKLKETIAEILDMGIHGSF